METTYKSDNYTKDFFLTVKNRLSGIGSFSINPETENMHVLIVELTDSVALRSDLTQSTTNNVPFYGCEYTVDKN